jgi:hypothetical protein
MPFKEDCHLVGRRKNIVPHKKNRTQGTQLSYLLSLLFVFATSCNSGDSSISLENAPGYVKGEYINRMHDERLFNPPPPEPVSLPLYPWEDQLSGRHPKITKEYFRCKGCGLNLPRTGDEKGEVTRYFDCGGSEKHSLPLRDNKEFIYPILIDLLNDIQARTGKRVIITSGHRCPEHNTYVDPSKSNQYSKHMLGAEVSFYVQGLENKPEDIVQFLQEFYQKNSKYSNDVKWTEFQRWDKGDTDVSIQPWYNKEIFIKLYKKNEGRNIDNRHPYPYISVQVRFDADTGERVIYSWDKANRNYMRW